MKNNVIAVIPARKGSKRCVNKNFRMFCGKPLITWTIEAALKSRYINKIIISTDLDTCKYANPLVEIDRRPNWLATDKTTTDAVIHDLRERGKLDGLIVLLQPTSPLRTVMLIDEAIERFLTTGRTVISVNAYTYEPNGVIYVYKTENIYDGPFFIIEMSGPEGMDIDYEYQFKIAESLMYDRFEVEK